MKKNYKIHSFSMSAINGTFNVFLPDVFHNLEFKSAIFGMLSTLRSGITSLKLNASSCIIPVLSHAVVATTEKGTLNNYGLLSS